MAPALTFYFDFISPYAYIAWTQIHALVEPFGRRVEPAPVLFAALLNANGQKGPAEIPRKREYVFKDVVRTARLLGLPIAAPPSHPFNPLLALRVCSLDMPEPTRRALIDALFAEVWGGGRGVTDPDHVDAIAARLGVHDASLRASDPEIKARVKTRTDQALAAGAFGTPTMVVDDELFWGYDSFGHLSRFMQGNDPLDDEVAAALREMDASATR